MRRTALARKTPLDRGAGPERKTALRASSEPLRRSKPLARGKSPAARSPREKGGERVAAPGRTAWYRFPRHGICEACGRRRYRQAHHALQVQHIERLAPAKVWDLRVRMLICVACHEGHHARGVRDRRIDFARLRPETIAFAREVLGGGADLYFYRRYRNAPDPTTEGAADGVIEQ